MVAMTAKEVSDIKAELARLQGLLLGANGAPGVLTTIQRDIGDLKRTVKPLADFMAEQRGLTQKDEVVDRKSGIEVARSRLRIEGDNARWAAIAVIAGGVPIVLRLLGL